MKTVSRLGFAMSVLFGGIYLSATNPAYADDAPFLIEPADLDPRATPDINYLIFNLIAEKDGLVINNIIINKGHCFAHNDSGVASFPITLDYSQSERFSSQKTKELWSTICPVLEIDVQTNEGTWSFRPN